MVPKSLLEKKTMMTTMTRKALCVVLHYVLQCLTNPPGEKTAAKEAKREAKEEGFGPSRAIEPEAMSRGRWGQLPKA